MPGEGVLPALYVGNRFIDYLPVGQAAIKVVSADGTTTTILTQDGEVSDLSGGTLTGRLAVGDGGILSLGTPEEVTIDGGVATITKSFVKLLGEGDAADQLDTLTLSGAAEGDMVTLISDDSNDITVDDANIDLGAGTRVIGASGHLTLRYNGTSWVEQTFLAGADNS